MISADFPENSTTNLSRPWFLKNVDSSVKKQKNCRLFGGDQCWFPKKNETTPEELVGTLQNGFEHIFGSSHRWGWALQNGFDLLLKTTNTSTQLFWVFFGNCYLVDSMMIEPYTMVLTIPGNLKIAPQNGFKQNCYHMVVDCFSSKIHFKTIL